MKRSFVQTTNVRNFASGLRAVDQRGAPEACLMLVTGDAGFGKTKTGEWWALSQDAPFVRLQAAVTPHWVLKDIARELGETAPAHNCEQLMGQVAGLLIADPRPVVIDEVEHALHDQRVIETIRGLADIVETPFVLLGREAVQSKLRRDRAVSSRISAMVNFGPATAGDVRQCCDQLAEAEIRDDVVERIHHDSEGYIREIVNAIAIAERVGRKEGKPVDAAMVADVELVPNFRRTRRPALKAVG